MHESKERRQGGRGYQPGRLQTRLRLPTLPEVLRLELQLEPAPGKHFIMFWVPKRLVFITVQVYIGVQFCIPLLSKSLT